MSGRCVHCDRHISYPGFDRACSVECEIAHARVVDARRTYGNDMAGWARRQLKGEAMNRCGTCKQPLDYEGAGDDCDGCKTAKLRAELADWKRRALAAEAERDRLRDQFAALAGSFADVLEAKP